MANWIAPGFSAERLRNGTLAGLAGGVLFGVMMAAMGMMATVGSVIGTESLLVAWLYHLFNSIVFGIILALVTRPESYTVGSVEGLVWGIVLWVVAASLLMRTILGMPISFTDQPAMMSLIGHLVYGLVTGITLVALNRRTPAAKTSRIRTSA